MSAYDDEMADLGPGCWADEAEPTLALPPMRTFRVFVLAPETAEQGATVKLHYLDAHSVTCDGDAAKFYVYRADVVNGVPVLAAYSTRTLRPYLDVEDVSAEVAATSKLLN